MIHFRKMKAKNQMQAMYTEAAQALLNLIKAAESLSSLTKTQTRT